MPMKRTLALIFITTLTLTSCNFKQSVPVKSTETTDNVLLNSNYQCKIELPKLGMTINTNITPEELTTQLNNQSTTEEVLRQAERNTYNIMQECHGDSTTLPQEYDDFDEVFKEQTDKVLAEVNNNKLLIKKHIGNESAYHSDARQTTRTAVKLMLYMNKQDIVDSIYNDFRFVGTNSDNDVREILNDFVTTVDAKKDLVITEQDPMFIKNISEIINQMPQEQKDSCSTAKDLISSALDEYILSL